MSSCKLPYRCFITCFLLFLSLLSQAAPRHYVFFNRDRERITDKIFLETKTFEGAQLKYTWRELEPLADQYDFAPIRNDLRVLKENGKRLFIQLQDTSFDPQIVLVPRYLMDDPRYHGGADKQYNIPNDDETKATPQGWVARRWDRAVRERFHKLLLALGKEFDGQIEGLNLPETAVDFGEGGRLFPSGFTVDGYRDAILDNLLALKRAFPKSVVMQYANFMPGEWLPGADHGYLRSVYRNARDLKVGVGAPDLLPYRPTQMAHAYPLLRESAGKVPTGIAVQWGNYEAKNPKTGKRVTVAEIVDFATTYLKSDYVFWCLQEPFFTHEVIPFLRDGKTSGTGLAQ